MVAVAQKRYMGDAATYTPTADELWAELQSGDSLSNQLSWVGSYLSPFIVEPPATANQPTSTLDEWLVIGALGLLALYLVFRK